MTAPSVSQDSLSPRHPVLAAVAQEDSFGDLCSLFSAWLTLAPVLALALQLP